LGDDSREPFSLQVLLANIEALYAPLAAERGLGFSMSAGSHIDGRFIGNQGNIAHILRNVISNAIGSTEHGEIAVTSLYRNGCLRLSVSNTGRGLSRQEPDLIHPKEAGIDLESPEKTDTNPLKGLTLTETLCHIVGGRISVKSDRSAGTILTVSLPLQKAAEDFGSLSSGEKIVLKWQEKYKDKPDLITVLNRGIEHLKLEMQELPALAEANRWDAVSEKLHAMKGFPGGFGLSEIYERIKALEGQISGNDPDKAAFFRQLEELRGFVETLPPLQGYAVGMAAAGVQQHHPHGSPEPTECRKRILVADDDRMNCEMIGYLLRKLNLDFAMVHNGEEVLKALESEPYDVLLLDMRMPVLGGLDTLERIRRQTALEKLCIIAMTANDNAGDEGRYKALGCDEFVAKPIDLEELTGKIRKAIAVGCQSH